MHVKLGGDFFGAQTIVAPAPRQPLAQDRFGNIDHDRDIEQCVEIAPWRSVEQKIIALDDHMLCRIRYEASAGAGNLEVAVKHRHGDFRFVIAFEPHQHVIEAGNVECLRRPLSRPQSTLFQHAVVKMIAIHREDFSTSLGEIVQPRRQLLGQCRLAGARWSGEGNERTRSRLPIPDNVNEFIKRYDHWWECFMQSRPDYRVFWPLDLRGTSVSRRRFVPKEKFARMFRTLSMAIVCWLVATPVFAADEATCSSVWMRIDANGDGILQGEEAVNLVPEGTGVETPVEMTEAEFADACLKGYFDAQLEE